jgi:uncharacterized phage protein gp47/JayE
MPFPLPTPEALAESQAATMEAALRALRPEIDPAAIGRAVRSPQGLIAAHVRTDAQSLYETHLHLRWWGDQYMPDSAEAEHLVRHASIWGVYRRPATKAVGNAVFTGVPGTVIPAGLQLRTPLGALVETTIGGTALDGAGEATVPVEATDGGAAANTAPGALLPLVTTLVGLDPQSALLDGDGLAGGAAEEEDGSLLARLLAVIREPGHGGAAFDYPIWVFGAFAAAKVKVIPNWVGPGSLSVVVAMGTPAVPLVATGPEIAAIAAHVEALRPVTAEVIVLSHIPLVQPFSIALVPDTVANRAAVTAAIADHFARESEIGGTMPLSRLSEAISAASGEYSHAITVPAADIEADPRELAVPGAITWVVA